MPDTFRCDEYACEKRYTHVLTVVQADGDRLTLYACRMHFYTVQERLNRFCMQLPDGWKLFTSPRSSDLT